jgi:CBS domain-containing membrane protein
MLITAAITIGLLCGFALVTHLPFVFPSLGPSTFLIYYAATKATACPRNVFFSHLIGTLCGYAALVVFGLTNRPADLEDVSWQRLGAVTLALCATLTIMVLLGVAHAPAAATTLIVALGLLRTPWQLAVLMLAVCLLILIGFAINRFAKLDYPVWGPRLPQ